MINMHHSLGAFSEGNISEIIKYGENGCIFLNISFMHQINAASLNFSEIFLIPANKFPKREILFSWFPQTTK